MPKKIAIKPPLHSTIVFSGLFACPLTWRITKRCFTEQWMSFRQKTKSVCPFLSRRWRHIFTYVRWTYQQCSTTVDRITWLECDFEFDEMCSFWRALLSILFTSISMNALMYRQQRSMLLTDLNTGQTWRSALISGFKYYLLSICANICSQWRAVEKHSFMKVNGRI